MNPKLANSICSKAFTMFCGVCEYDDDKAESLRLELPKEYTPWSFHTNPQAIPQESILHTFNSVYYESLISSIFPDYSKTEKKYFNNDFARNTFRISRKIDKEYTISPRIKGERMEKQVMVDYIDIFLFPANIAFYCFKCDFNGISYDDITLFNNHIRNNAMQEFPFISESIRLLRTKPVDEFVVFGNKLKTFCLVEMGDEMTEEQEKGLLYDLATSSPVGSGTGESSFFQPTPEYLQELWNSNAVNVFDNWKGMCLFDSFTALFRKGLMNEFIWENAYFNLIFLHSLYIKNYLFKINKKFYLEDSNKQKLEDEFYEFDKYFNLKQISFNFLPQIIYQKIRNGFDIEDELAQLQTSIERANSVEQGRRDKSINNVLTIIALLTVFSIIWDISEWFNKIFFNSDRSYVIISVSLTVAVSLLLLVFVLKNYRKKIGKWRRRSN